MKQNKNILNRPSVDANGDMFEVGVVLGSRQFPTLPELDTVYTDVEVMIRRIILKLAEVSPSHTLHPHNISHLPEPTPNIPNSTY